MKIIDRYLMKQLLMPILLCAFMLMVLVFMADIFDYLDEMVKNKTGLFYILKYYLILSPQTFVDIIPWASLLGTIYVLTTFNVHNELTAMKVAGLEITSIIRPIIFIGFFLGIISFLISDQIVPKTSMAAEQILKERIEKKKAKDKRKVFENITYYGGKDRLYYARTFYAKDSRMEDFIILWLDGKKNVKKKTVAREAKWTGNEWILSHATDYSMQQKGEMLGDPVFQETAVYPELTETPDEFLSAVNENLAISYRDLKDYIAKLKENGIKISTEVVTLHQKLSIPWQSMIVMFLTVPFLAKSSTKRLIAFNILLCIAFVFFYHVTSAVMFAMGKAGKLFPLLSAWTPNFIFGFGTFFFLDRANH